MPAPATPTPPAACSWSLATPPVPGAVAIIDLLGDIDLAFHRLQIPPVHLARVALRSIANIDSGLIARWSPSFAQLMPHGGTQVVRDILAALNNFGIHEATSSDPRATYPEAADDAEAHVLAALARAASPLAIDRLLAEPARWREHLQGRRAACTPAVAQHLQRLINPPLVVALGPANIGKSTLMNTLAGRNVAIVADEPGTTRDHVGVLLDLAGLVVRYADTPGLRPRPDDLELQAQRLALDLARHADLLLLLGDAASPPPDPASLALPPDRILRVALRHDLAPAPWTADARVSALASIGLADLAQMIRERLLPASSLTDPGAWNSWT